MSAGFKVDLSHLRTIIDNGIKNIGHTKGLMSDIGETLVSSSKERFEKEIDPNGNRWVKGLKKSGKTLANTGLLKRSITHTANITEVIYGSNLEYASIHNTGGTIKTKSSNALKFKINGSWVTKKKVVIPKRQFVGISKTDIEEAKYIICQHIADSFKGNK